MKIYFLSKDEFLLLQKNENLFFIKKNKIIFF